MLTRTLRRTVTDPRCSLPPTFLCPWTASLTTESHPHLQSRPPPDLQHATNSAATPSSNPPPLPSPRTSPGPSSSTPTKFHDSITTLLPLLRAQHQIYITAHIHARPYLITQGDTIRLPFLMPGVQPGDIIRLNRAINLGSRDYTLRAPAKERRSKSPTVSTSKAFDPTPGARASVSHLMSSGGIVSSKTSASLGEQTGNMTVPTDVFVPHLAKGQVPYMDDRLFVCRAVVMGVESEPLRVKEKTEQRRRHVRHIFSKHKYTVLRIKELRVKSLDEIAAEEQLAGSEPRAALEDVEVVAEQAPAA